jgi:hypothetical protein
VNFLGNDVWYTFTLAAATTVLATTCDDGTNYDTVLGVFTSGPVAPGHQ